MRGYHLTKEDYEEIKGRLDMAKVATAYGYPIRRRDLCLCPFHQDRHPSMKLYKDGFYCFSCGAGGDIVTFVARLYGMKNQEAAKKLVEDFALPVRMEALSYREKRQRDLAVKKRQERDAWIRHARAILMGYYQLLCDAGRDPADIHFEEAIQQRTLIEYWIECIEQCPDDLYKDRKAVRRIGDIERRIAGWYEEPSETGTNTG